ncbi:type I restriction endonuclease subunit R [Lactococcus petauri]|uniref:type I restriction endonuclease subunit R n=1 Tax=Lactococcus petauri TaxID=1940789 RepID=UPI0013FD39C8|nr:HsdR family type I site-specific deoxyribonuclease [Lactococcus petauri]NHI78297.1 type I restriction endonuclease subunit R [Lactococcus petauri]
MVTFTKEADFEEALINLLCTKGWEKEILRNPTEKELIDNWAKILYDNNPEKDRLNGCPLTDGEMEQIIEQINALRTPLKLNGFINGKTVSVTRDNPADELHFGKEVSLKIYDRREIAAGQSRYQIAQQPKFPTKSKILNDRRGDLMLLINGIPVFHLELKRSGVPVSQATNQIEKYAREGIFTGLFSLVQIFVAMEPEETKYFANPGPDGTFNSDYYFHWEDFNNEIVYNWKDIASSLLSIPMAHQLIGFYTVADDSDGVLKVMRSYQYYAANAISDKVTKNKWDERNQHGGYIWHTTGSGKTMTSFKSAQLIAGSKDADKVIFLMDRIELGTQSLREYKGFAEDNETVQKTENTKVLKTKLKSSDPADTLIITSIQKMSNIEEDEGGMNANDIVLMNRKRIVFIIDEAHRSTFGEMLRTVKTTFPKAIFFGFTGTPIKSKNERKHNTTSDVFGDELHRYTIADGIRDKNVLGFDPYQVTTFKDSDVRKAVAIHEAKAKDENEAVNDPKKSKVYYGFMDKTKVKMAGFIDNKDKYHKGIEDYLPNSQYSGYDELYTDSSKSLEGSEHQNKVVEDIVENWLTLSRGSKFHAIFATNSIPEAIKYYRLLKNAKPELKTTALFDPNIDNGGSIAYKEDGLVEIIDDYNKRYNQSYEIGTHGKFKQDISNRFAHKYQYKFIDREPEKQIDLLIVVDQMLTGFDSKWINTLYIDKLMRYENIIQAFSRTNRLFGEEKPFGTIRYYRKPHTMERNIDDAVALYSGDKPVDLFVDKLEGNLNKMNILFEDIKDIFEHAGVQNFEKLPAGKSEQGKFASLFNDFNDYLEAAKIQGFNWNKLIYEFSNGQGKAKNKVEVAIDESTYFILVKRYKELGSTGGGGQKGDIPFDLKGYITERDTGVIDSDYMNSRFKKYLKALNSGDTEQALNELHKSFATLSQEEQKYANLFLRDIERGDVEVDSSKTLRDYINEYQANAQRDQIRKIVEAIGVNENKLRSLIKLRVTEANLNEFGRFDDLISTVDRVLAKQYLEKREGNTLKPYQVSIKVDELLKKFIFEEGFDI